MHLQPFFAMNKISRTGSLRLATSCLEHGPTRHFPAFQRPISRALYLNLPRHRGYATAPKPPKETKSAKPKDGRKPAKGFEGLYNNGSPMSSTPDNSAPPPVNPVGSGSGSGKKLSKEDEATLDQLFDVLYSGVPKTQKAMLQAARQEYKDRGEIPKEVRDVMEGFKKDGMMSMASAASMVRMIAKLSREFAAKTRQDGRSASETSERADQEEKSSPRDDKSKDSKKRQSQSDDKSWWGQLNMRFDWGTFASAVFITYITYRMVVPGESSKEITFQEFKATFFDKGLVEKLTVINGQKVRVTLHRDLTGRMYPESPAQHRGFNYVFSIGSVEAFDIKLEQAQNELGIPSSERIPVKYTSETNWTKVLIALGPTAIIAGSLLWMLRRGAQGGSSGLLGIGKSKAKKFNHETDIQIRFKDVAGMDEAKTEIMEFVSFLKDPSQYQRLGAKIPRGALLSGPPGTGKTLLAKATAGESQVPFYSISGSEFVEIFVGVGASRVRDLFTNARKNTPCIIFIDEIDAVGKARSKGGFGSNDEREGTLNQILTEMDGFNTSDQVVVLAGTNRPDVLDKALLRPGRFDRHIAIDKPTVEGRKQIFNVHLGKIVTNENIENLTGRLAALTPGFSGADIANCVNEAALIAARTNATTVQIHHFEQAIERVIGGLEKKSLVLNPEEKRTVAYHEAGHAICGWFFKYADPLLKVSIIPRGQGALGYAQYLPQGDVYLQNVTQLMDRMAMALGGRVSEELHFDTVTSGASDDFNKVTRMATAMVTKFGMSSKIGYLYFEEEDQKLHKPFSEETARNIDAEVRRIVDEAYKQCRDLLEEKKKEVGMVAEELLRKEVLGREDLIRLLGVRPFPENKEFSKYFDGGNLGQAGGKPEEDAGQSGGEGAGGAAATMMKRLD